MFLEHVDNLGKFLKFFVKKKEKKIPLLKKGARTLFFCRFLKNAVPCRFSLLKFYNFCIFYLTDSQVMTKTIFTKSYHGTKYKGGTSLKAKSRRKILVISMIRVPKCVTWRFFTKIIFFLTFGTCCICLILWHTQTLEIRFNYPCNLHN